MRLATVERPSIASLMTACAVALMSPEARADSYATDLADIRVDTIASGLEHPWGVEILPDGAYLVTERPGRLRIVRDGVVSQPIAGLPQIAATGQGGLLDVALASDFETSGTIFVSFSEAGNGGAGTAIARAKLVQDVNGARLEDGETIFSMARKTDRGQHFGSRIAVRDDGTLFFSIGDRGDGDRAQDMRDHAGAILRINADGSIPADNPHADGSGGLPEIWSKGHRNPQGLDIDPATGDLISVEHGARGGDEINAPRDGLNYGWPVVAHGRHYSGAEIGVGTQAEGYEPPLYYWDPSIAPGGMAVYRGAMFPEWDGDLLVAALKYQLLARLDRDETGEILSEERMLAGEFGRIRDVEIASDGAVVLLTNSADGAILRLSRDGQ